MFKIKTQLALTSNSLIDNPLLEPYVEEQKEDHKLLEDLTDHTKTIAKMLSPNSVSTELKLFNSLILTQKLLTVSRKKSERSAKDALIESWLNILPGDDLSSIIYWDKSTLNEVDSELLR